MPDLSSLPLLTFGVGGTGKVPVSLEPLIVSKLLVTANSGGGKSQGIRYLLEQTNGRIQHIVLDREGEFATLREKYPYLLAGRDGDVAADVRSAKLLARKLLELGLSAIIDLSEMSLGQQKEYVRVFIDAINHLPRALWKDCLIVIDEAHLFAPEKGKGTSVASEAIALLLSTGRKRGFGVVLATQRIAKLDKDVSAECLNKMIGRTSQEDLYRAADELGMSKVDAKALRSLEPGSFWAYGPAIGADPIMLRTGSVATQPPKRGTSREPAPVAPAAIKRAMAELADLPKQAADEERSMEDLRRELRDAQSQLARTHRSLPERVAEKPVVDQRAIDRAVAAAVRVERERTAASQAVVARFKKRMTVYTDHMAKAAAMMETAIVDLLADAASTSEDSRAVVPVGNQTSRTTGANHPSDSAVGVTTRAPARPIATPISHDGVTGVEQRILNTIAGMMALGVAQPDKATVAALVGYHPNAKSYSNAMGSLRTAGRIAYVADGRVTLTPDGEAIAENSLPVASRAELHRLWFGRLGNVAERILAPVLDAYPSPVAAAEVAEAAGYHPNAKSFSNMKGRLRTLGLIDYPSSGMIVASHILFPQGLC